MDTDKDDTDAERTKSKDDKGAVSDANSDNKVDKENRTDCTICGKRLNVKSIAKHMRTIHPQPCEVARSLSGVEKASARRSSSSLQNCGRKKKLGDKNKTS